VLLYGRDLAGTNFSAGEGWCVRMTADGADRLLTTGQVAVMCGVNPRTVNRWASEGRLGSVVTPGGHHRFRETEILALLVEWDRGGARVRAPRRQRHPG
jgi:excisionase family DNA binding protein